MTIYSNHPPVRLSIADGMPPLTAPLIRPVPDMAPGLRAYSLGEWDPASGNAVTVTETGHWFHVADKLAQDAPAGSWTCRGCGIVVTVSLLDPRLGRCTHPATGQGIASALLGRTAVSARGAAVEPGDCQQPHRYQIYCAALDDVTVDCGTAPEARRLYDAIPEAHEPVWHVVHLHGSYCSRESQRQEVLGMRLDAERVAA